MVDETKIEAYIETKGSLYQEMAKSDPQGLFSTVGFTPYNPSQLVTRKGIAIFDSMRKDEQVKAAMGFKKHAVLSSGWEIVSPEGQPEDWEVTEFVKWNLQEYFDDTLEEALLGILTALDYGYSVSELIWEKAQSKDYGNKIALKAIKNKRPHEFDFKTDEFGNLLKDGIIQRIYLQENKLPIDKFILFSYEKEFGNHYGKSDLEICYRAWWIKDNAYKWFAMMLERLGIPPIFALYDPSAYTKEQLADLKTIFSRLQAATTGIIPKGRGENSLEFWNPELAGESTDVFIKAFERFDLDITRALLMPGLLGASADQTQGSLARSQVHFDMFMLSVEYLRNRLSGRIMQEQVIKRLVDLNYVVDEYPTFKFLPVQGEVRTELLTAYVTAVEKGIIVKQESDEAHLRQELGFPEIDEDRPAPVVEPVPEELAAKKVEEEKQFGGEGSGNWNHAGRPGEVGGSGEGGAFEVRMVPASSLVIEVYNENIVGRYKNQINAGEEIAPVLVNKDDTSWIVDGNHRAAAFAALKQKVPVVFVNRIEALLYLGKGFSPLQTVIELRKKEKNKDEKNFSNESQTTLSREINKYEQLINFNRIDTSLTDTIKITQDALIKALTDSREALKSFVERNREKLPSIVKDIKIKGMNDVESILREFMRVSFEIGRTELRDEVPFRYMEVGKGLFTPTEALQYLNSKAFWIKGIIRDQLVKDAQALIYNAIQTGELPAETIQKLHDIFEPYVGTPSVIVDKAILTPHRLETILRTNVNDAFNQGRLIEARSFSPGLIQAMEFSAILDNRTTEICRELDGKLFRMDDPDLDRFKPSLHFNCRSMLVAVPAGIEIDRKDFITGESKGAALDLMSPGFGGNITKLTQEYGGEGSGNWGHEGRPGQVGGSGEGGEIVDKLDAKVENKFIADVYNKNKDDLGIGIIKDCINSPKFQVGKSADKSLFIQEKGNITGAINYEIYKKEGVVHLLGVIPSERGKGTGSKLLVTAIEKMYKQGMDVVKLQAAEGAIKFYEKLGFKHTSKYDMKANIRDFLSAVFANQQYPKVAKHEEGEIDWKEVEKKVKEVEKEYPDVNVEKEKEANNEND